MCDFGIRASAVEGGGVVATVEGSNEIGVPLADSIKGAAGQGKNHGQEQAEANADEEETGGAIAEEEQDETK